MRMGISTTRAKSGKLCQSSKSRLRGRTGQSTMEMDPVVNLSGDDIVIRIWQPNPAKRIEADSPFRSLLPILSDRVADRHIFAQLSSRLAGAGILSSRRV